MAKKELDEKDGSFVVLYSPTLVEYFMVYNSIGKKGKVKKKCVYTNCFDYVKAPKDYSGILFYS